MTKKQKQKHKQKQEQKQEKKQETLQSPKSNSINSNKTIHDDFIMTIDDEDNDYNISDEENKQGQEENDEMDSDLTFDDNDNNEIVFYDDSTGWANN